MSKFWAKPRSDMNFLRSSAQKHPKTPLFTAKCQHCDSTWLLGYWSNMSAGTAALLVCRSTQATGWDQGVRFGYLAIKEEISGSENRKYLTFQDTSAHQCQSVPQTGILSSGPLLVLLPGMFFLDLSSKLVLTPSNLGLYEGMFFPDLPSNLVLSLQVLVSTRTSLATLFQIAILTLSTILPCLIFHMAFMLASVLFALLYFLQAVSTPLPHEALICLFISMPKPNRLLTKWLTDYWLEEVNM